MPGWGDILDDDEMWHVVRFIRHIPPKGSLEIPAIYKEEQEEHEQLEKGAKPAQPEHEHHHHH